MSSPTTEHLLTFGAVAKELPHRPAISTLHRWRLRGIRGVRLESWLVGGRRFTSREAIERFIATINAVANGEPPPSRTPRQRERAIGRAERELGIAET